MKKYRFPTLLTRVFFLVIFIVTNFQPNYIAAASFHNDELAEIKIASMASTPPRFLTLPFSSDSGAYFYDGWWYTNSHVQTPDNPSSADHQGIDYLRSDYASFPVLAAADGEAKWRWSTTYGNVIEIKHIINQETWYTIYAHLQDVYIPQDNNFHHVDRGTHIGNAGKTGVWPEGSANAGKPYSTIHLHFELSKNAPPKATGYERVDPYGVYGGGNYYPGNATAFTTNPPSYPGATEIPNCNPPSNGIPRDNNLLNNNNVIFSWTPPSCNGMDYYTFRVSNHADIDNPPWILDHGVNKDTTSITETIPSQYNGQTLYWAIWPHNSVGYGSKGGPWQFKIDTSMPPQPPPLPTGTWNVQYFRNKELTDQCSSTSFDRTFIFQDWGEGAPTSGCNTDNWGARFTRRVYFLGGNYNFALDADDWGRIYVDGNLFVDKWNGASQHIEGHYVSSGDHDVRVEFADTMGGAKISAWWYGPGFDIPQESQDTSQWYANYWINPSQWEMAFAAKNEGTGKLSHDWGSGSPGWDMPSDQFSAKFRRTVNFECGHYSFNLDHDDGARFYLDDQLIVDRWGGAIGQYPFILDIDRGNHNIQVDYYENGGAAHIMLDWQLLSGCQPNTPSLSSPLNDSTLTYDTDLTLSWNTVSGATHYLAQLNGGPNVDINSDWLSGTQWYIGELSPGMYTWSVTARNEYGSTTSGEWSFTIQDPPSSPAPSANFDSWPQNGDAPLVVSMHIVDTSYITSCEWDYGDGQTGTQCSGYHDHTYNNPGTYTVSLTANGPGGSDSMTRTNYISVAAPAFSKTSPTDGITNQPTSLTLDWGDSSGTTSYEYCYDTSNDNACSPWISTGTTSQKSISGLSNGTTYYWHVRANNSGGITYANGGSAAYWDFTTVVSGPGAFNKASPANGVTGVSTSPTISWGSSSGATSYEYCYDTTNDNACSSWNSTTGTSINLSGLSYSTTYYWHVRANNSGGTTYANANNTTYWNFTTQAPPVQPPSAFAKSAPGNSATNQSTILTLDWGDSSGVTGYEYCYDTSNDNACTTWTSTGTTSQASINGLSNGTTYYWQVRANNSSGTTYANGSTAFWSFTTLPNITCPTITNWKGEYWNNSTLSGSPTLCRDDFSLMFEWKADSPDPSIPADNFSARWTRTVSFTANTYRFRLQHDDGARLYIDDVLRIDKWSTCCTTDTAEVQLIEGNHTLRVEMNEISGYAGIELGWEPVNINGWRGEYFNNQTWTGNPVLVRDDPDIDYNWGGNSPDPLIKDDGFSVRWTKNVNLSTGTYRFDIHHDDGARFTIDDQIKFENLCTNCYLDESLIAIDLTAGIHKIKLETFDNVGGASARLRWLSYFNKTSPSNGATNISTAPTLTWQASNGATKYEYCIDTTNNNSCDSSWNSTGINQSVALNGLSNNTIYYWHVRASYTGGIGIMSSNDDTWWNFSIPSAPPLAFSKSAPANGVTGVSTSPTISWGSSSGATSYEYCYDTTNDNACSSWNSTTGTSINLSGLSYSTTYYWHVRANNSGGITYANGSNTVYWSFTTVPSPSFNKTSPANAATNQPTSITLDWGDSSGVTSYEYCYDTTNDNACSSWTSTGITSQTSISGLNYATTYYWQVRASNYGGTTYANSSNTAYWSFSTMSSPAFNKTSPANAAINQPLSLTLDWGDSNGVTSYEYCYDTTNDNACSSWTSAGTTSQASINGLSNGTTYYWQVRANNNDGITYANGSNTAFWNFTTIVESPSQFNKSNPASGVTGVSISPTLSWGSSSRATSYEYCYDTTNDNSCSNWTSVGTSTQVSLSGLNNSTTYYWHVRAANAGGTTYSNNNAWSSFTTIISSPDAFNKSAPTNGATGIATNPTIRWGSSGGATSYEYCYDTSNDSACSSWNSTTETSVNLNGLSYSTVYYWQVRAVNAGGTTYGNGSNTAYWSFTTVPSPAFNKSSPVNAATNQPISLTLDWGDSSGVTSYEYCYDTSNDNACSTWTSTGTTSQAFLSGLSYSTTYYWHVRASNIGGTTYSNNNAWWSFTTETKPNPAPELISIDPNQAETGSQSLILIVNGKSFVQGSTIRWNGTGLTTTFVSDILLSAVVSPDLLANGRDISVTVFNPVPGGGESNALTFSITNPVPILSNLSPAQSLLNSTGLTLTINGDRFVTGAKVQWNTTDLVTTYISRTQLSASVPSSLLNTAGEFDVKVVNPVPGGGASSVLKFTVTNPIPVLNTLSPSSAVVGSSFTLTANGSGFVNGAVVRWNGSDLVTTFVSSVKLTATVPAGLVTSAGTANIKIYNPVPGGGESSAVVFTINNGMPGITGISPDSTLFGGNSFTLIINGSGFVETSMVQWNNDNLSTSYTSSTRLTAQVPSEKIAVAGTASITVTSPAPGGGKSNSITFTINNPPPSLTSISPSAILAGGTGFTLTVDGENFVPASKVRWNGGNLSTTFVSNTRITAEVPAANIASAGTISIDVFTPVPGGGISSLRSLSITNPVPSLTSLAPTQVLIGSGGFALTVTGDSFVSGSKVRWNTTDLATTFVGRTQLSASVPSSLLSTAGEVQITVFNLSPGGGVSSSAKFTVANSVPTLSSLSPFTTMVGNAFTLTANGSSFVNGAAIRWNGNDLATTYINSTKLTAQVPSSLVETAGTAVVKVFNPAPGGGESTGLTITFNNPAPVIASLTPNSAIVGGNGFSLTITGTGFVTTSMAQWNNDNLTTNFVSSTELNIQVPAGKIATAGSASITVTSPAPGGGKSAAVSFAVNNPRPVLLSMTPDQTLSGGTDLTLSVNGNNFIQGAVVRWDTTNLVTTFVSSTQLTASIPAALIQRAKSVSMTVSNPIPGGGVSDPLAFNITNPLPEVLSFSPEKMVIGAMNSLYLCITGKNFAYGAQIDWNGDRISPSTANNTSLCGTIPGSKLTASGMIPVAVYNSIPGGGLSNSLDFVIENPKPAIYGLSPNITTAGSGQFTLNVYGSNFVQASTIVWDGESLPTTFVSSANILSLISVEKIATAGNVKISVVNPALGGGTSQELTFTIVQALPLNGGGTVTIRPVFDWEDVAGATSYSLQVSTNSSFTVSTLLVKTSSSTYTPTINLPQGKTLYWRVRPNYGTTAGTWLFTFSFLSANPPPAPGLVIPASNSLTTDYTPRLDWSDVNAPVGTSFGHYHIEVATDASFVNLVHDRDIAISEFTPDTDLSANTTYYWRVRSHNTQDQCSAWSLVRTFRTSIEPPILTSPAQGDLLLTTRPAFDWEDVIGAKGYNLQISSVASFRSLIKTLTTTTSMGVLTADLSKNSLLYWRVIANGTNGPSLWSEIHSFTTGNPPSIPVLRLPATNAVTYDYRPLLDWNDAVLPLGMTLGYYQIQVDSSAFFTAPVIDQQSYLSEFRPGEDLVSNTAYYWRVRAYNTNGHYSAWSGTWILKTAPSRPTQVSPADLEMLNTNRPEFDWEDVTGATSYTLQISNTALFRTILVNKTMSSSNIVMTTDLPKNSLLYWRVKATSSIGSSLWSDVHTFTTGNPPSVPVLRLPASGAVSTDFRPLLDWNDATLPAGTMMRDYQIQIAANATFTEPIVDTQTDVSQFQPTNDLTPNTTFYWRVRAYNTNGHYSGWSAAWVLKTVPAKPIQLLPGNFSTRNTTRPTFDWEDVSGATSYTIMVSTSASFSTTLLNKTATTSNWVMTTDLPVNRTLYWKVRAKAANGYSLWSDTWQVTLTTP